MFPRLLELAGLAGLVVTILLPASYFKLYFPREGGVNRKSTSYLPIHCPKHFRFSDSRRFPSGELSPVGGYIVHFDRDAIHFPIRFPNPRPPSRPP